MVLNVKKLLFLERLVRRSIVAGSISFLRRPKNRQTQSHLDTEKWMPQKVETSCIDCKSYLGVHADGIGPVARRQYRRDVSPLPLISA